MILCAGPQKYLLYRRIGDTAKDPCEPRYVDGENNRKLNKLTLQRSAKLW